MVNTIRIGMVSHQSMAKSMAILWQKVWQLLQFPVFK